MPIYSYGSTVIVDGVSTFLMEKPFSIAPNAQTMFKIARQDGMKLTGETVNDRTIQLKIKVIGTSRADLENTLSNLYNGLRARQQPLTIYAIDSRYFVADAVSAVATLIGGQPISTELVLTFICQQPFAYSTAPVIWDTDVLTLTASSGNYVFPTQAIVGGGNVYSLPQIRVIQQTPANATTLTTALVSGTAYTQISVTALSVAIAVGDTFILSNSAGTHTQTIVANQTRNIGDTTIHVTSFTANFAYGTTATVTKDLSWQSITVAQATDGFSITTSDPTVMPNSNGDYVDFFCDPTVPNGWTVQLNSSGTLGSFNGIFPKQKAVMTLWVITVAAKSPPQAEAIWLFTPRWLP